MRGMLHILVQGFSYSRSYVTDMDIQQLDLRSNARFAALTE